MTETQKPKLWTRNYILAIVIYFFLQVSQQISMVAIPLFAQYIGGSKATAGLTMTVFTISALAARPVVGYLCDTKGRKFVLISGLIIFAVVTASYNFAYSILLLAVLRFLHGTGFSGVGAASSTIISDVTPKSRLMEGIGYYGISITLAGAIGPMLAIALVSDGNYHTAFIFSSLIVALSIIGAFMFKLNPSSGDAEIKSPKEGERIKFKELLPMLRPPAVMFFTSMAQISILTFIPTYALSAGFSNSGLFYTVQAFAMMFSRPFMGKMSDRYGTDRIVIPGAIVLFTAFIILAVSKNSVVFLVCAVFNGLGIGAIQPILQGLTVRLSPDNARGMANAAFFSSIDLGYGVGAAIWGALADLSGFTLVFSLCAASVGITILLYLLILKKHTKTV